MSDSEQLRVLLVEDNPGDARLVAHHLEGGSFPGVPDRVDITTAESVAEARDALEADGFDVVLLDLGLPESAGTETLDRFPPDDLDVPVVVLTGLDDKEAAVEAIQRGAQDYLPKGDLDADVLLRSLRYAIEREKQERALRRQTEQLRFFTDILRHDVGNGMEVIRQNASLLKGSLDGEDRDRAGTIVEWSDDMIDLAEKVRRMLQSATGDAETASRTVVDLSAALRDRIETVEGMDGVEIEAEVPDGLRVVADDMLADVLGNVLTNAVEHNDAATPRIVVETTAREEWIEVVIADNGPGIPDEVKERIFRRGATEGGSDGGFGLYFVATMVDSYGGEITVENRANADIAAAGAADSGGTVFRLRFRAAEESRAF
jgi:signal transduction histidine kinase